ncbi:MAG: ATP synthase F0 subunit B [Sandaracinaceae bacterium]
MPALLLEGSPILDVDLSIVLYLVAFGFLFLLLRRFVFSPVMALFDAREEAIDGAASDAKALEEEAETKYAAFRQETEKVRREGARAREKARAEGLRQEREITEEARAEADRTVREAEARMAEEAETIRAQIRAQSPQLAREIAAKLLGRELAS